MGNRIRTVLIGKDEYTLESYGNPKFYWLEYGSSCGGAARNISRIIGARNDGKSRREKIQKLFGLTINISGISPQFSNKDDMEKFIACLQDFVNPVKEINYYPIA